MPDSLIKIPGDTRRKPTRPALNQNDPINRGLTHATVVTAPTGDTLFDLTGRYNGAVASDFQYVMSGEMGLSLDATQTGDVDSSSEVLVDAAAVGLNAGTFSMWVTPTVSSDYYTYFADTDGTRHAFYYRDSTGQMNAYIDARTETWTWALSSYLNKPHLFTFGYDKGTDAIKFWVDGVAQSGNGKAGTWGSTALGSNFYWGNRFASLTGVNGGNLLDGYWHGLRIYQRLLSNAEVQRLYLEPYAGLVRPRYIPVSAAAAAAGNPWYYYAQQRLIA